MGKDLFFLLVPLALIDMAIGILPDILICGLLGAMWSQGAASWGVALFLGGIMVGLKKYIERRTKKPAVGWGDIKLIGVCGLALGWHQVGLFLLGIGLTGGVMLVVLRRGSIPLGPCIILIFTFLTFYK